MRRAGSRGGGWLESSGILAQRNGKLTQGLVSSVKKKKKAFIGVKTCQLKEGKKNEKKNTGAATQMEV